MILRFKECTVLYSYAYFFTFDFFVVEKWSSLLYNDVYRKSLDKPNTNYSLKILPSCDAVA